MVVRRYKIQQITEIYRTTNNAFEEVISTPKLAGLTWIKRL